MNIIITAGGTRERIDAVRAITNDATGKLGSLIAEEFSRRLFTQPHKIYYLCGIGAIVPKVKDADLQILHIEGTDQLLEKMSYLLTTQNIHAVIHSMAVSDYKVSSVTTAKLVAQAIFQQKHDFLSQASCEEWEKLVEEVIREQTIKEQSIKEQTIKEQTIKNQTIKEQSVKIQSIKEQKISSDLEHPILMLEKTPKIIGMIKETSPKTVLVGFKLLSGVSKEKLIETAYGLLQRNQCDYVLANDTETIRDGMHKGYLINKRGSYETFESKEQIAKGIADVICQSTAQWR